MTLRYRSYQRQKMQGVVVDNDGTNGSSCTDRAQQLHISRMQSRDTKLGHRDRWTTGWGGAVQHVLKEQL